MKKNTPTPPLSTWRESIKKGPRFMSRVVKRRMKVF
jgi:hypothetical protein